MVFTILSYVTAVAERVTNCFMQLVSRSILGRDGEAPVTLMAAERATPREPKSVKKTIKSPTGESATRRKKFVKNTKIKSRTGESAPKKSVKQRKRVGKFAKNKTISASRLIEAALFKDMVMCERCGRATRRDVIRRHQESARCAAEAEAAKRAARLGKPRCLTRRS